MTQPFLTHKPLNEPADPKVAHILQMYAAEEFPATRAERRLQMRLLLWSIQLQIVQRLKRGLDLVLASVAVLALMPLMLLTALAIRLESPGPVIFKQARVGKWGKPFTCYKFRSMCIDAEARKKELLKQNEVDGPIFKMQVDPRVTRVGRIIRKLSIDELPQLFNVIKGDMSLVGPRPPVPQEVSQYKFDHLRRLDAIPGLTGLQQVSGRSDLSFERWVELDMQYIAQQSLRKDIEILLKTIPAVLLGKGAY
ncbi:MAG: sugar transferase [Caldilineaceae bacterium]|nr:sugar transferase [Caldilineaceae bacterium]